MRPEKKTIKPKRVYKVTVEWDVFADKIAMSCEGVRDRKDVFTVLRRGIQHTQQSIYQGLKTLNINSDSDSTLKALGLI